MNEDPQEEKTAPDDPWISTPSTVNAAVPAEGAKPDAACPSQGNGETKSKRSSCLIVFLVVMVLLLGLVFAVCCGVAAMAINDSSLSATSYDETILDTLDDNNPNEQEHIVVLPINGVISDTVETSPNPSFTSTTSLHDVLHYLEDQDNVCGVILEINSPGGAVSTSDNMYHELTLFKKKTKLPVIALFDDMACSGGYYVAMGADHLIAHPTSDTGSIGVIMELPMMKELLGKVGVEMITITSLNDKGEPSFKDMGSMFREMKPEERQMLQDMVTECWTRFTGVVAEGRKGKLTLQQVRHLADGRVYTAPQALKAKLIDQIGYTEEAYAKARELAKCPNADIVSLAPTISFSDMLFMKAADIFSRRMAESLSGSISSVQGSPAPQAVVPHAPRTMYMAPLGK